MTATGKHIIRNRKAGCVYITPVPSSNPLHVSNPPLRELRCWSSEAAVARFIRREEYVHCPEDCDDWEIVGSKATRGCYIEGGGLDAYIIEEIGLYVDNRAPIKPGLDSTWVCPQYNEDLTDRSLERLLVLTKTPDGDKKYVGFPPRLFKGPPEDITSHLRVSLVQSMQKATEGKEIGEYELKELGHQKCAEEPGEDGETMEKALEYMITGEEKVWEMV